MKKYCLLLCLVLLLSSFPACDQMTEKEGATEAVLSVTEEEKAERYPYDLSEYVTLPDPFGVTAKFADPKLCTEEEMDEAILQIRLRLATFEEAIALVEDYSKVVVDYTVLLQGQALEEKSAQGISLVVGLDTENGLENTLAETLVGFGAGNQCYVEYTYPDSVMYDELAGKTVVIRVQIKEVYRGALPEFNEELVRSMEGFETYSLKEFRAVLKKDILARKAENQRVAVWDAFTSGVVVHAYPEAELAEYRSDHIAYYTSLAQGLKMEMADFLSEYMEMTVEEFKAETQRYAEEMVKNDMIFTQLARTLQITLSDEEYRLGAERYFEAEKTEFDSVTEFITHYTEDRIRENLIRDKALMTVVEHAVRAE